MNGKDEFLLDTNVILGLFKGQDKKILNFFHQKQSKKEPFYVSQVSRMELLGYPGITAHEENLLNHFLSLVTVLPINDSICNEAIVLCRKARIKLPDSLIAATAVCHNLILVTCDTRLLSKAVSLQSINPSI